MSKLALLASVLLILLAAGCATVTPTPTATTAPKSTQVAPVATPISLPVATNQPVPTITPTAAPPTTTPSSTPTVVVATTPAPTTAPGLYLSNLRIDPNPPTRGTDLIFYATFVNTTNVVQNYKWIVYIYRPDSPNKSNGETTASATAIPVGTNEVKGGGSWKIALGGPCENFIARPVFFDSSNQPVNFIQPNGKVYEKTFTVCAPVDLPTGSPVPSPTPTPTPTFAPGMFAIDLRTDPNPPTRGSELAFYVTFANTTGSPQPLKWNIFIYKPGERNSTGELTATTTVLANGINDYSTLGTWNPGPGGPCEDFVARVSWFDNENKPRPFTVFENQPFERTFSVCPP